MSRRAVTALLCCAALVLSAAGAASSASAAPEFWTESGAGRELLRDVNSIPRLQPAAIEFNNNGPVVMNLRVLKSKEFKENYVILCNEFEYGTAVVSNLPEGLKGSNENTLSLPWGVAESDSCREEGTTGGTAPIYFDTTAAGVVPATITFSGTLPTITAKLHKLRLSIRTQEGFCTATFENTPAEVVDSRGPFVEETTPNTSLVFHNAPFTGTCTGKVTSKFIGELSGALFVETISDTTDTVWIE